ncbi:MAG: alpha/beta hydrolase [Planctomycetes bacterium]|nr:alpha/beta hydrolase [Planctomycetota bacterium]
MSAPHVRGARRWRPGRITCLTGMAAGGYLAVLLILLTLESRILYRPVRAADEWLPPPNARVRDVLLHTTDGTLIHAWWCPTDHWDKSQGALLYCHGTYGNLSLPTNDVRPWQRELGAAVLTFDYPGYGRSEGQPSEEGCYAAAEAAFEWLTQIQQVAPEHVLLVGNSLGGGPAVELADRHPHRALVLCRTFTSIPDMAQVQCPWLPARWLVRNHFENLAKIGRCAGPVFIVHGAADRLIPPSQGKDLFEAAPGPKEFILVEGLSHNDPLRPEVFQQLRTFLKKTAPPAVKG